MLVHQTEEIVRQIFESDAEYADCFLLEVSWKKPRLMVFFDADSGVTLQKCQKLSRLIESVLEESSGPQESYILEVSSGGLDRPLKFHRQYLKNIGRYLSIHLMDGREIKGKLLEVNDESLSLELKPLKPHPKKEKAILQIFFKDIKTSIVQISI